MDISQIVELLNGFSQNEAKLEHLNIEIGQLEISLAIELGEGKYESVLKAYNIHGVKVNGNSLGSPVERWYEHLEANGGLTDYALEINEQLISCKRLKRELLRNIGFVNAWLKGINAKERWVVEQHIIKGKYWWEMSNAFRDNFGYYISSGGLKKIKKRALGKICEIANKKGSVSEK